MYPLNPNSGKRKTLPNERRTNIAVVTFPSAFRFEPYAKHQILFAGDNLERARALPRGFEIKVFLSRRELGRKPSPKI